MANAEKTEQPKVSKPKLSPRFADLAEMVVTAAEDSATALEEATKGLDNAIYVSEIHGVDPSVVEQREAERRQAELDFNTLSTVARALGVGSIYRGSPDVAESATSSHPQE